MVEKQATTAELLEHWREATRSSELAARLAKMAADAVLRTESSATAAEELAQLAERVATAANEAATTARKAANLAHNLSRESVDDQARDNEAVTAAQELEGEARDRYHAAEEQARHRIGRDGITP